ncbi:MAG: AgmX/PglI C-terminal domain-containing protein [Deltaproteobacteria bacterium]|nr:AgmX/PglI C-terminal domain-containing protein [Deltaproteobacteria bacterium]
MGAQSVHIIALLSALAAATACSEKTAVPEAPQEKIELELVMPARSADDPCDDLEKLEALAKDAGGPYIGCGPLPRYAIREAVEARKAQLLACRRHARDRSKKLRFELHWTVDPEGAVHDVKVLGAPDGEERMQACIAEEVQKLAFPRPLGGGQVEVSWPFVYSPHLTGGRG